MAAAYRAPIFTLMDKNMNIDWYYGEQMGDIKEMDSTLLHRVVRLKRVNLVGSFSWQKNVIKLLFRKEYKKYLMLGDLNSLSTWSMLLLKPIFFPKKDIYLWSHGWYGRESIIKRWLKRIFFGLSKETFLYGDYARKIAIEQGNNQVKLKVIHNSLDYNKQTKLRESLIPSNIYKNHFKNDNPAIIFIGRLTKVKRLDMLINALKILKDKGTNVNLTLIGNGSEYEMLQKLVSELNLEDRVWFYGSCYDENQNAELIFNAILCVAPGNVGLTAMHTMAFGTPVLSHNNFTLQMPEFEAIKMGLTGDFFEYGSIDSLAYAIENWIEKHPNREEIRNNCIKEIEEYWTPEFQLKILQNINH